MKLPNPACKKAGYCLPCCGMCHLGPDDNRIINSQSLFGKCRKDGKCSCGLCKVCNGSEKSKVKEYYVDKELINQFNGHFMRSLHDDVTKRKIYCLFAREEYDKFHSAIKAVKNYNYSQETYSGFNRGRL